jgi:hypothetical protein
MNPKKGAEAGQVSISTLMIIYWFVGRKGTVAMKAAM